MSKEELNKILLNPDYAESLGVKVYVEVKDNGEKYAANAGACLLSGLKALC